MRCRNTLPEVTVIIRTGQLTRQTFRFLLETRKYTPNELDMMFLKYVIKTVTINENGVILESGIRVVVTYVVRDEPVVLP